MEDPPTTALLTDEPVKLILTHDTPLKRWPWHSKVLDEHQLPPEWRKEGETFVLKDHYVWEGERGDGDDHVAVFLENGDRYYVYGHHCKIEGTEKGNNPQDEPPPESMPNPLEKVILLKEIPAVKWGVQISKPVPGLSIRPRVKQPIFIDDPKLGTANFTWGEALHANPKTGKARIPANASVTYSIVQMAKSMQEIRGFLGDRPIRINSWYRDPATNRRVRGAKRSRHLSGDAVDFVVRDKSQKRGYIDPLEVYKTLNTWWGARGGLASSTVFTHIDARGYKARWSYGY